MIDLELAYRIPEAINGMRKTPFTIIFTIDSEVIIRRLNENFLPMKAACELVKRLKPKKVYVNFIIELKELNGKSLFGDDVEVESVLSL